MERDSADTERRHASDPLEVGPESAVPGLNERELEALRAVGRRWTHAIDGRGRWLRALPLDPDQPQLEPHAGRGRFVALDVAGVEVQPARLRRLLLGPPLASSAVLHERMRKLTALPILSSDALSSVAYGPEAMLAVLALAGTSALGLSLPIAAAIVTLMFAVGLSYRQIVRAYPHGGGSYVVALETLGQWPALLAAAALLVDYLLTVAVSISAGVAAVTSAVPGLAGARVELGLAVIAILLLGNLRGVREAGMVFSAPTYAFIVAMLMLVAVGLVDAAARGFAARPAPSIPATESVGVLLVLRAFSSGATAMTGIEAVSNAVPAFRRPSWRNARTTLSIMIALLIVMFAGLVVVVHLQGVVPSANETLLSSLAHDLVGSGVLYGFVQATTALVLLLAANTAFNGFPRLLSLMARNGHAPRPFLRLGDRLAFSNGTFLLAGGAALVYAAFKGDTSRLIPLYAVGVFGAFTVSQLGMVIRWRRQRTEGWRRAAAVNGFGAVLSGTVFLVAAATKFAEGAWVALLIGALLATLSWRIRRHYVLVRRALTLQAVPPGKGRYRIVPRRGGPDAVAVGRERTVSPDELRHLAVVPVARLDNSSMRALAYAASLGQPVLAVHVSPDAAEEERFRGYWKVWGDHLPLHVIRSPYRAIVVPTTSYIAALAASRPQVTLTVVLPELLVARPWHAPLHNGTTRRIRRMLRQERGIVVATVGFHLPA
jgi:amino acid transporter